MCPLVLNKEGKHTEPAPEEVFNAERIQTIQNRSQLVSALLASNSDENSPAELALRVLVTEDVPAMLETLATVLGRHST
jgi:hypothetical protein